MMITRFEENATIHVFSGPVEVQAAIEKLGQSGFDMRQVSVAGRDDRVTEEIAGHFDLGGGMKYWGQSSVFWEGLWKELSGWAFFAIPGLGSILVTGPLAGWIIAGLENATIFSGLSALGAAIYSIGILRSRIPEYDTALKSGKFLVLAHGTADEITRARQILKSAVTQEIIAGEK
jgi:hypothetical protein